tara:strand:+ start:1390 stop:2766 length:1377 start_codon:yes stop_codon:yes gene_type:complete
MRKWTIAALLLLLSSPVYAQLTETSNPSATFATASGSFTTVEDEATLNIDGFGAVAIQITGTWVGVVTFEASVDESTFTAVDAWPASGSTSVTTTTANGVWTIPSGGYSQVRARFSTDTSGTVVVSLQGTAAGSKYLLGSGSSVTHVDDAAFTPTTDDVVPAAAAFDDTAPDSVDEGDAGIVRMSANRNLYVTIRDAAGNERGLNIDANGDLAIALSAVDNAVLDDIVDGTLVVQEDGAALTALQLIDNAVDVEDTAAGAADSGLNVLAVRRDADTTLVGTDNDLAQLQVDANGYLKVEVFDGGGSHTVDGTITADAGTGPWPVTDNAGALTVDWAGTAPPIGEGASTAALLTVDSVLTPIAAIQSAVTTGNGTEVVADAESNLVFCVVWSAGVSAGVVTLEEAATTGYSGTWSSITTSTFAANTTECIHLAGTYMFLRARVSTTVVDGTVTVQVKGV